MGVTSVQCLHCTGSTAIMTYVPPTPIIRGGGGINPRTDVIIVDRLDYGASNRSTI